MGCRGGFLLGCLLKAAPLSESEMPKMKTKSGAKKRFRLTGTGKVVAGQAGKRHGMIKRTNKQIRNLRGTTVLAECDAGIVKQFLPYGAR
jgi:large subunit ribosomal protein L35